MARIPSAQERRFREIIATLEPAMRRAFLDAVAGIYSGIDYRALNMALAAGDIEGAIDAINIDRGAFIQIYQSHQQSFVQGATAAAATLHLSGVPKDQAATIRFDMTNPRAESVMATAAAEMVKQVEDDTRRAIRETILSGYEQGRGPRDIATDLVGRVEGGRRQGGVVGLDANRAHRLNAVARGMQSAEGVQDLVIVGRDGKLSLRYKVNPATEKAILAAYRKGTAVPEKARLKHLDQFRNALLKSRGDTIARTETAQAVALGRAEEWDQVLEKLGRSPDDVIKTWQRGSGGRDPRPHHQAANGMQVRGLNTPFVLSNGAQLNYPHDPNASGRETINCTCAASYRLAIRKEDLL